MKPARRGSIIREVPTQSLTKYRAKRNFALTTEPVGGKERKTSSLSFVIQKHWARSLHYDFRLELAGTLKSWAVPKGPSFDPKVKRMAVHVEDHPLAYSSFEGTIPAKQYGAGKVLIWDKGTWSPRGDPLQDYLAGALKFELFGHKLQGKWALIRIKGRGEKQEPWLLIKEKDEFARPASEFSVVDQRPESVQALPAPKQKIGITSSHSAPIADAKPKKLARTGIPLPDGAIKARLPAQLAPQLATLVAAPPIDPDAWVYEIKFDGYRLMSRVNGADIKLFTRNGHDWTLKLAPLRSAIASLKLPAGWYDGEIVVPDEDGVPDFGALQRAFDAAHTNDIVLYLFDLPFYAGHDLRAVPLLARRALLQRVLEKASSAQVRFSDVFNAPPESVVAAACKLGLEGIIAKRLDSTYVSRRALTWIKLKCSQRQEFVIGGYTDPQGARSGIGALLLGVHDAQGTLRYAGKVGTGFSERVLDELLAKLRALSANPSPFAKSPAIGGKPYWVKPTMVAEVSFGEWTRDGHLRHAVFRGLRTDKPAKSIVRESTSSPKIAAKQPQPVAPAGGETRALSLRMRVTNSQRVIDESTGTTKLELVRYYDLIGDLMMVHLARPVALLRAPGGIDGALFFQKHAEIEKLPGFRQLDPALDPDHPAMLEVRTTQGLLSAAQWNVVEFHTLNTDTKTFVHPNRMVFDLDPGNGVAWPQIQEAAILVHKFLEQLGLPAFLKTSGGKGLHIVVPLRKVHDWDTVKGFSQAIVAHLATTIPQRFVAKSGPKNRIGKIFIDYLRNDQGASTVCAWSARARPGLGISVPVEWSELSSLKGGDHWQVRTAHARLDKGNDPWRGYLKAAKSLSAAMKILAYTPLSVRVSARAKSKSARALKQTRS